MPEVNRRLLEQMLLAFADRFAVLDRDKRYLFSFTNPDGRANFVSDPEALIGQKFGSSGKLPPDVIAKLESSIAQAWVTGEKYTVEYSLMMKGRGEQFFEARIERANDQEMIVVARNITSRVSAIKRENFMRNVVQVLNSSLDLRQTLRSFIEIAASGPIGEMAVVRILDENGRLAILDSKCSVPEKAAIANELVTRYSWANDVPYLGRSAIAKRKTLVVRDATGEHRDHIARSEDHYKLLREFGAVSSMAVPLMVGDRLLGSLALMRLKEDRLYDENDVRFVEEIAKQAALAIDRAQTHRKAIEAVQVSEEVLKITTEGISGPSRKIAHEIGQILSVVSQIDDPNLKKVISKSAKAILRSSEEIESKLEDLKEAGDFWSSRKVGERVPLQFQQLLEDAVSASQGVLNSRGVHIETEFASGLASILCDPVEMGVLLREWIKGFLDTTQRGGDLKFQLRQEGSDILLTISRAQYKLLGRGVDELRAQVEALGGRVFEELQKPGVEVIQLSFPAFNPS